MVYPPSGLEPGRLYPTVIYCYGGPQIQVSPMGEQGRFADSYYNGCVLWYVCCCY